MHETKVQELVQAKLVQAEERRLELIEKQREKLKERVSTDQGAEGAGVWGVKTYRGRWSVRRRRGLGVVKSYPDAGNERGLGGYSRRHEVSLIVLVNCRIVLV